MADLADKAQEQNSAAFEAEQRNRRRPTGPEPKGLCHNCATPVPNGVRWCDDECRDDWQDRVRLEARRGK